MEKYPLPGTREEIQQFTWLQQKLTRLFEEVFPDPQQPRTIVVIPSLTLDKDVLSRITGLQHYEERMLFALMLLRMPRTQLIYITSQPIHPSIIDYYLHLLPGVPSIHAARRLKLFSCHDASHTPLTQKILERPRLLSRIQDNLGNPQDAHMTCFTVTPLERTLAVTLGIPIYGCDPDLAYHGSKSGGRRIFREAGVQIPEGFEGLKNERDIVEGLSDLKLKNPKLKQAVVKLDEGFSGEGNAVFKYNGCPTEGNLNAWVNKELSSRLAFEAKGETWETFSHKFSEMGGIVESFVEGEHIRSPSMQGRIDPLGNIEIVSTHDQVLGGPSGQVFLGCTFPAHGAYRLEIQEAGQRVGSVLQKQQILGRYGVDFISVKEGEQWAHYAIEINIRKGGTTHPYLMLQFLTDGYYDTKAGLYKTPSDQTRYYYASDNLQKDIYKGLTPKDLIDIVVYHNLHFHSALQKGVMFHLIGALSEYGKLGIMCISDTPGKAQALYEETISVLDAEAGHV